MPPSTFSSEHKAQFRELLARGVELHANNASLDKTDFGPWSVASSHGDREMAERVKAGFRAAARRAAVAAGAPSRVHVLNWWIGRLARGKKLAYIQGLIERSIEYCDELESNAAELGPLVG